jgi:hypothetical protein
MGIVDDLLALPARLSALHEDVRLLIAADIPTRLTAMEARMTAAESAAHDQLRADIETVGEGWAALVATNAILTAAVANADQATRDAVAAAIEADDTADTTKIDAAAARLRELTIAPPASGASGTP